MLPVLETISTDQPNCVTAFSLLVNCLLITYAYSTKNLRFNALKTHLFGRFFSFFLNIVNPRSYWVVLFKKNLFSRPNLLSFASALG